VAFTAAAIAAAALAAVPSAAVTGLGALATGLGATTIGTGLTSLGATIGGLGATAGTAMGVSAPMVGFASSLGTGLGNVIAPLAEGLGGFLTGGGFGELGSGAVQSGANLLGEFGAAQPAANLLQGTVTSTALPGGMSIPATLGPNVSSALAPVSQALNAVPGAAAGGTPIVGGSTGSVGGALQAASTISSAAGAGAETPTAYPAPPPPPPLMTMDRPGMTMDRPGMTMDRPGMTMAKPDINRLAQEATRPLGSPLGGRTAMSARTPAPQFEPPSPTPSPLGRTSFVQPSPFQGRMAELQEQLWRERQKRNSGSW